MKCEIIIKWQQGKTEGNQCTLVNAAELFEKLQEQLAIQIRDDKLQVKKAERQLRLLQKAEAKKEAEVKSATAEVNVV